MVLWTVVELATGTYFLAWFLRFGRIQDIMIFSSTFEILNSTFVWWWIRRNWFWIDATVTWRSSDFLLFLLALSQSFVNSLDPWIYLYEMTRCFHSMFRMFAIFFELYWSIGLTCSTAISFFLIYKIIWAVGSDLAEERLPIREPLLDPAAVRNCNKVVKAFFGSLLHANSRLDSVLASCHVMYLSFFIFHVSALMPELLVCANIQTSLSLQLIIFGRMIHFVVLYYCGNRIYKTVLAFRRQTLKASLRISEWGRAQPSTLLVFVMPLRDPNVLSVSVFGVPLRWTTSLWFIGISSGFTAAMFQTMFSMITKSCTDSALTQECPPGLLLR